MLPTEQHSVCFRPRRGLTGRQVTCGECATTNLVTFPTKCEAPEPFAGMASGSPFGMEVQ
jgi:hypothetical protein